MLVNRVELLNEMKKITKMVGNADPLKPIIKGVLIEYKSGELKLTATNLATSIITKIGCETDMTTDEAFVVDAKLLHDITSKLTSDDVEFDFNVEKEVLKLVGGTSRFNIMSLGKKDDFPKFEMELEEKKSVKIPSTILINLVNKTIKFTSDDDTKPTLKGVNLVLEKGRITGVSLDGYRMAHYVADIECDYELSMIVDAGALANIARSIDGEEVVFSFSDNSKQLEFVLGKTAIYSSTIEGAFFNYKEILKHDNVKATLTLSKKNLKDAVDRASIMAKASNAMNPIVFSVDDSNLVINSNNEVGKVVENVNIIEHEGEKVDFKIAFNPKYVLDGVNSVSSENVELKLNGDLNPAYLIDTDNGFIYLMLPIRLNK